MSRGDLGHKITCEECGTRFYDLNKTPAICPKCGATNERPQTLSQKKIDSSSEARSGSKNNDNLDNKDKEVSEITDTDLDVDVDIQNDEDADILGEPDETNSDEETLEGVITNIKNSDDS